MLTSSEIHLRDPFVLPVRNERKYYLYGTTDEDPWKGPGTGFDLYRSSDLQSWEGPFPAFRPEPGFWADRNFWAPEVHEYRDGSYLFASFKAEGRRRATQILKANAPSGPFHIHSPVPVTPRDWECLDGTLYVDRHGFPWLVFCHEWVQVHDGQICTLRLSEDLRRPAGEPLLLFTGSQAPWTRAYGTTKDSSRSGYVTDGPFLFRASGGRLFMLWSGFSAAGYAMGISWSQSGEIEGPWHHCRQPIVNEDGGHGMVFRGFDGKLYIAVHAPNNTPHERPLFIEIADKDGMLVRKA